MNAADPSQFVPLVVHWSGAAWRRVTLPRSVTKSIGKGSESSAVSAASPVLVTSGPIRATSGSRWGKPRPPLVSAHQVAAVNGERCAVGRVRWSGLARNLGS
jgi:hypothetical protein